MIRKFFNKIILIALIIILCFLSFSHNNVFADREIADEENGTEMTIDQQLAYYREKIANYCETNFDKLHSNVMYSTQSGAGSPRQLTLQGKLPNKNDPYYYLDCVGWVTFAITRATGIIKYSNESVLLISAPETQIADEYKKNFKIININSAERGDILITDTGLGQHVAIYLGNNEVSDMWHSGLGCGTKGTEKYGELGRTIDSKSQSSWHEAGTSSYFKRAARLISLDGQHFGSLPDGIDVVGGGSSGFQYSGIPSKVSVSGGKSFAYYIQKIGEIYDYMIGIMLNAIKSIPIAIANGIQGIITDALNFLNGN